MWIVFLSNFLNHHQKPFSDALYRILDGKYRFIATDKMPEERRQLGYKETTAPYLIEIDVNKTIPEEVSKIIFEADAVIIGSAPYSLVANRVKSGKLTFVYTERLYKKEPSLLRLLKHFVRFQLQYNCFRNVRLLCASAFTAGDFRRLHCFKNRSYKWGYFPKVEPIILRESYLNDNCAGQLRLLWIGRFLDWKHPELAVEAAIRLKKNGIKFCLSMYGVGPLLPAIERLVKQNQLEDCVTLYGSAANDEILYQMQNHDIVLFTSDRNEGWGAVANEAMSSGAVLIAADSIGCVPYLIKDKENGLIFRSCDPDDLFEKVLMIANNKSLKSTLTKNATQTMNNIWSPEIAATRIVQLIKSLNSGKDTPFVEGPCSKA